MKFYEKYQKALEKGEKLPDGVQISIGSMGSVFFSDVIGLKQSKSISEGEK